MKTLFPLFLFFFSIIGLNAQSASAFNVGAIAGVGLSRPSDNVGSDYKMGLGFPVAGVSLGIFSNAAPFGFEIDALYITRRFYTPLGAGVTGHAVMLSPIARFSLLGLAFGGGAYYARSRGSLVTEGNAGASTSSDYRSLQLRDWDMGAVLSLKTSLSILLPGFSIEARYAHGLSNVALMESFHYRDLHLLLSLRI